MMTTIKKLRDILTRREKLQVLALLAAVIGMAFSQAIGVASVLAFISLVMEPNMVFDNRSPVDDCKKCDRIYLLDRGKIAAESTYDLLKSSNEQFQRMAKVRV